MANGFGGFGEGGRTYEIVLEGARETPLPWTERFRAPPLRLPTTSCAARPFREQPREPSHAFRERPGERPAAGGRFVRDEETADVFGATPGVRPREKEGLWLVTHEAGLSRFRRRTAGIVRTFETFVALRTRSS